PHYTLSPYTTLFRSYQSGSMTTADFPMTMPNGTTQNVARWTAMTTALTNATTGVIPKLDGKVIFGATLYTGIQAANGNPAQCPKDRKSTRLNSSHSQ